MSRCFSCGTEFAGGAQYIFTCPSCENVEELKNIREETKRMNDSISAGFQALSDIQERGFNRLSEQLSSLTDIVEWGLTDIIWELHKQQDLISSIDETLKSPLQTQANELRIIAEELRNRNVLDESEKRFLQSLNKNPLDFRTYVGLAHTYLKNCKFNLARDILEKSLPHAPKGLIQIENSQEEIDPRSYCYNIIARTYYCEGNYSRAFDSSGLAIKLSPGYHEAQFEYARYAALLSDTKSCISSLKTAISCNPKYFVLAQKNKDMKLCHSEITQLLNSLMADISNKKLSILKETRININQVNKIIEELNDSVLVKSSIDYCHEANNYLKLAKDNLSTNNYVMILRDSSADEALTSAQKAITAALDAVERHKNILKESQKRALQILLGIVLVIIGLFITIPEFVEGVRAGPNASNYAGLIIVFGCGITISGFCLIFGR